MKKEFLSILIASVSLITYSAHANEGINGLTIGAGYQIGMYSEDGFDSASPSQLQFRIGKVITQNFSLRFDYYVGLSDDEIMYEDTTIEIEVDSAWSIFAQPSINLDPSVKLYGLFGFSNGELTVSLPEYGYSVSDDDSGVSFGAGIQLDVDQGVGVYAEYVSYLRDEDYNYNGFNLGVSKTF